MTIEFGADKFAPSELGQAMVSILDILIEDSPLGDARGHLVDPIFGFSEAVEMMEKSIQQQESFLVEVSELEQSLDRNQADYRLDMRRKVFGLCTRLQRAYQLWTECQSLLLHITDYIFWAEDGAIRARMLAVFEMVGDPLSEHDMSHLRRWAKASRTYLRAIHAHGEGFEQVETLDSTGCANLVQLLDIRT